MSRYEATKSITSVASHPCACWAMASAAIRAERFWLDGYLAISRSMRLSASGLSMIPASLPVPVFHCGALGYELRLERCFSRRLSRMASPDGAELAGIGVLPDVGVDHRADRDVPEFDGSG